MIMFRNLRFSLSGVAGEVVNHLAMSSRDTDVTVRRAAVMVVTLLLQVRMMKIMIKIMQGWEYLLYLLYRRKNLL